jgi:hypothetical protein
MYISSLSTAEMDRRMELKLSLRGSVEMFSAAQLQHAWKFRMTNFLMGKGFWDYVEGENEDPPELPEEHATAEEIKAFKDWNQGARKVMYWLSVSVIDTMIGHIQDAHTPAEAWQNLVQMF